MITLLLAMGVRPLLAIPLGGILDGVFLYCMYNVIGG